MTIDEARALIPPLPDGWSIDVRVMRTHKLGNHEFGLEVRKDGVFVTGNRGVYDSMLRSEIAGWVEYVERRVAA